MHNTFIYAHTQTQNLWFGRNVHLWHFLWPKRPWLKCPGRNVLGQNVRGRNVLHSFRVATTDTKARTLESCIVYFCNLEDVVVTLDHPGSTGGERVCPVFQGL